MIQSWAKKGLEMKSQRMSVGKILLPKAPILNLMLKFWELLNVYYACDDETNLLVFH